MFDVVLYQPEIPPNTGNIIRLCANTGSALHLIEPLGFEMDDKRMRRAGLDYHDYAEVSRYADLGSFLAGHPGRLIAFSTRAVTPFAEQRFAPGDQLLFGPETRGLPTDLIAQLPPERTARLPMVPGQRSLNLANAVAVVLYEAWRQQGYAGAV